MSEWEICLLFSAGEYIGKPSHSLAVNCNWPGAVGVMCVYSAVARKRYLQKRHQQQNKLTSAMKIKTSLLTIISVVAVAAAAFPSFDAEKLDANSAGSLAATAETFPSFNQNATATASFPLSNAESDAMAAAFLPWLFLLRLKRRLAQHLVRKRNHSAPSKRRLKPALLWTTALLMAGILTVTALANPLGLIPWIEHGRKAWALISTAATLYTIGDAIHVLVGSKPGNTGADMAAKPSIYDDHPNYESPTVQHSGASDGITWGGSPTELSDESLAGNYASYRYDYYWVDYDEETGECSSRPHATHERATAGGVYSEDRWIPKSGWDWLYAHSGSARRENPITDDDSDIWARAGFWVHYASSSKYEYPDVPLQSRIYNPGWGSKIDGGLQAKAKELGYTYDVKLHADLIKLTWVAGKNGEDGKWGHWTEGATVKHFARWDGVKGYEDDFKTIDSTKICLPNHKMEELIGCYGGIKIWWDEIIEDKQTTVLNQDIDANGAKTGPITTNTVVLPHHKWVTRHEKKSTDR